MFGALIPLPYKIAAVVVALAMVGGIGYYKGRTDGRQAQLKSTIEAYRKREGIDNDVQGLAAHDLCRELGGGVQCDELELRGVAPPDTGTGDRVLRSGK
jgi:hypothetical protein